jgi:hypothetical protein
MHAIMQPLQWFAFVFTSTHCDPHKVEAGGVQPVTHWYAPLEPEQRGAVASHGVVHEPHVSAFDKSVSQPSLASMLQLAYPLVQLPRAHCPVVLQVAMAWSNAHGAQSICPQPVAGSVLATQAPLQSF